MDWVGKVFSVGSVQELLDGKILDSACKQAKAMEKLFENNFTNGVNSKTAVECILREALGSSEKCDILRKWEKDEKSRPAYVTDDLLKKIKAIVKEVKATTQGVLGMFDIDPDTLVGLICKRCELQCNMK